MADPDTTPPVLTSLTYPSTIDVTTGGKFVTVSVGASDVGLGVNNVLVAFKQSWQGQSNNDSYFSFYDSTDSFSDGISSSSEFINSTSGAGRYDIDFVALYDKAGNSRVYYAGELTQLGFQTSFAIVSNAQSDTTPPVLTSLTYPSTIDVTTGGKFVTVSVGASDVGLGVNNVLVAFKQSWQGQSNNDSYFSFYDSTDSFSDGISSSSEFINSTSGAGRYDIDFVALYDKAGNSRVYYAGELTQLGFQTSFAIVSNAQSDTTPPVLTSLTYPSTIDVTTGGKFVTVSVGASDVGLGVNNVLVAFKQSWQGQSNNDSYFSFYDSTDSFSDGISSSSEFINSTSGAGRYDIDFVALYDKAGNSRVYYAGELTQLGFQTSFTIVDTRINETFGAPGPNAMSGGYGDDTYYVDDARDQVIEAVGQGNDRVIASTSFDLGLDAEIETIMTDDQTAMRAIDLAGSNTANVIIGNDGANLLIGRAGNDTLSGGGGNDVLIGGVGSDTMDGGAGDDSYYVDSAGDVVVERVGGGYDRIYTSVSYDFGNVAEVEVIAADTPTATLSLDLAGANNANIIYGNDGANTLIGRGGDDVLVGRAGNDTFIGGTGADYMDGGAGDDIFYIDNPGDLIIERIGGGVDRAYAAVSVDLGSVEELEIIAADGPSGTAALDLAGGHNANIIYGNAGANTLIGRGGDDTLVGLAGNDVLIGGSGIDTMSGGAGNDQFYVDVAGDVVVEAAGGGYDVVYAGSSWTMGVDAEIEVLQTDTPSAVSAVDLTGNRFANMIVGNAGANTLDGKGGADVLIGGAGADRFAFTTALGGGNVDTIRDFTVADDKIVLDSAVFYGLSRGALASASFLVGKAATGSGATIVYDAGTGALWFDADGAGAVAAVQFATVDPGLAITETSFLVI